MLTDHTNVMVKKKDCQIRHLPLDKSHFITEIEYNANKPKRPKDALIEELKKSINEMVWYKKS